MVCHKVIKAEVNGKKTLRLMMYLFRIRGAVEPFKAVLSDKP